MRIFSGDPRGRAEGASNDSVELSTVVKVDIKATNAIV